MSSLVVLEISRYPVRDADLQVIGLSLPLLQHLLLFALVTDAHRELSSIITFHGLEYLKNLTSLKHLTLVVDVCECHESVQLVKNCLQLMPQVNTVGSSTSHRKDFVPHEFPSYKDPVQLGLEHLVLGEDSVIPSNVTLPSVTRVTVVDRLTISLKQFEKLSRLSYKEDHGNEWSQVQQTLSQVGHRLNALDLRMDMLIDLKQVLQSCPNLEKLKLHGILLDDNFHSPQWKNCVQKLKTFKQGCRPTFYFNGVEECFNCPGLLHLLLTSCPELEKLYFQTIELTKSELDLINGKMEAGALSIQKLQKCHILSAYDQDALVSIAEFATKLCVKNCNIFKYVNIKKTYNRQRGNVEPEMKLAYKLQDHISNKRWLLDRWVNNK